MKAKPKIVYTRRGDVEVGTGQPGYRWTPGYSETTEAGGTVFPWMTRRECQADARNRGAVAVFAEKVYLPEAAR